MAREAAVSALMEEPAPAPVETPQEAPQETPQETPSEDPKPEESKFGDSTDPDLASAFEELDNPKPKAKADEEGQPQEDPDGKPDEQSQQVPLEDDERMPKQLRMRVKEQNKIIADYERKQKELNTKLAEFERNGEAPALVEAIKEKDAAIDKLKGEIAGLRFQESDEFVKKYKKPFEKAAGKAQTFIEELEVIETDDMGMQSTRPAKWKTDFVPLWQMPAGKRFALAQEKFGPAAPAVLQRLEQLTQLNQDMHEAREEEQATWSEKAKQRETQQAIAQQETNKMWQQVNKEIADKHPDWFAKDDEDEAKEIETKARELADYYFNTRFSTLDTKDQVVLEAQMKQRFIALPVVLRRLKAAEERTAQLEKEISDLTGSDPRSGTRRQSGSARPTSDEDSLKGLLESAFED